MLLGVVVGSCVGVAVADQWDPVRKVLDSWPTLSGGNMSNFCFSVGTAKERIFTYEVGNCTMDTIQSLASSSKMPAMSAIMGAVVDGHLKLDDPINQYLDFWTKDPTDERSEITLRHLLSFTSGYYNSGPGSSILCVDGLPNIDYIDCVKKMYSVLKLKFKPGSTFDYNSYHLQIAGAAAAAAAKMSVVELLDHYLIKRLGMKNTTYGDRNPGLAATMQTTGNDYDIFLRSYLNYSLIPKEFTAEIEHDYTADPGRQVSSKTQSLVDMIGHYGFAHWYECLSNNGKFSQECIDTDIHSDEGLFGYYPLIDRPNGYYFQQVFTGTAKSPFDYTPTSASIGLRMTVKPLLDAIVKGLPAPEPRVVIVTPEHAQTLLKLAL